MMTHLIFFWKINKYISFNLLINILEFFGKFFMSLEFINYILIIINIHVNKI